MFDTAGLGVYTGNILASEPELRAMICEKTGEKQFDAVAKALPAILEGMIGDVYCGPLGIDMMAVDDADAPFVPVVEMNLRMTMGHLCARFYDRYVANGAHGHFSVSDNYLPDRVDIFNGKINRGHLNLVAPGGTFTFSVDLE